MRSLTPVQETMPMLFHHKPVFAYLLMLFALGLGVSNPVNLAHAQSGIAINQPVSPVILLDGNKIMDAKPAPSTKPRKPAAPAPADSYTSRGGVPQSSTEETHLSNGLVCKTEKGQRTCR